MPGLRSPYSPDHQPKDPLRSRELARYSCAVDVLRRTWSRGRRGKGRGDSGSSERGRTRMRMFSHDRECRFKPAVVSGYYVRRRDRLSAPRVRPARRSKADARMYHDVAERRDPPKSACRLVSYEVHSALRPEARTSSSLMPGVNSATYQTSCLSSRRRLTIGASTPSSATNLISLDSVDRCRVANRAAWTPSRSQTRMGLQKLLHAFASAEPLKDAFDRTCAFQPQLA